LRAAPAAAIQRIGVAVILLATTHTMPAGRRPSAHGRQPNRIQLSCAAHQSGLDVADHPRINAAEVMIAVI
jgi:hypothetical protein